VRCKKYDAANKPEGPVTHHSTTITPTGEYCLFALKRFNSIPDSTGKYNEVKVDTPVLITKTITINSELFTIEGIIVHKGVSIKSGHYIYLRKQNDAQWSVFDDSTHSAIDVTPDSINLVLSSGLALNPIENGYVFLYKRVEPILPGINIDTYIGSELEVTKRALIRMFNEKYANALQGTKVGKDKVDINLEGVRRDNMKPDYDKNKSISEYIKDVYLKNIDVNQGNELYDLLDTTENVSTLTTAFTTNSLDILNIDPSKDAVNNFLQHINYVVDPSSGVAPVGIYRTTPLTGGNRRKTLRLQSRQKPGRRALSHKQVHHKEDEDA